MGHRGDSDPTKGPLVGQRPGEDQGGEQYARDETLGRVMRGPHIEPVLHPIMND